MMTITHHSARRGAQEPIGYAVARVLSRQQQPYKVLAVIPTMISYFANCPERYEVTDVSIIIETEDKAV